jgi:hypothetical protein
VAGRRQRQLAAEPGRVGRRAYDAELSDTVPATRAITVEDVLSFRLGFGSIFTAGPLPVAVRAEQELQLKTLGPPWPPTPHTPETWIAAFGSLPLLDQPAGPLH